VKDAWNLSLKRKIGFAAALIVLLHILLSSFILVIPKTISNSNSIGRMYNRAVLVGPFFDEPRIKTSPHLYVRYFENERWTPPRDYAMENFAIYCQRPWRYDKLRITYAERYLSNKLGQMNKPREWDEVKDSRVFRELNQFLVHEYLERPTDSIRLVYGHSQYFPETHTTRFDTTFTYTYNPNEIAPAK
jgi:hypothetical protein